MKYYLHESGDKSEVGLSSLEKDSSALISNDLKWRRQCNKDATKAISVLGRIKDDNGYINFQYCVKVCVLGIRKDMACL